MGNREITTASRPTFPNLNVLAIDCPGTQTAIESDTKKKPTLDADLMRGLIDQSSESLKYAFNQMAI